MDSIYCKKNSFFLMIPFAISAFLLGMIILTIYQNNFLHEQYNSLYLTNDFQEASKLLENKVNKNQTEWHNLGVCNYTSKNYLYSLYCFMQARRFNESDDYEFLIKHLIEKLEFTNNVANQLPKYKLNFLPWIFLQILTIILMLLVLLYVSNSLSGSLIVKKGVVFLLILSYGLMGLKYLDTKNIYGIINKNDASVMISPYSKEAIMTFLYQGQVIKLLGKNINDCFLIESLSTKGWIESNAILK